MPGMGALIPPASKQTPGAPAGNAGMAAPQSPWVGAAQGMTAHTGQATMPTFLQSQSGQTQGGQQLLDRVSQAPPTAPAPSQPGEGYGPGFGEKYGMSHVGQYDQPTALESFATQQMNGNNPYYDRLRAQGEAGINQQMAARGHYNSGGALSALGNFDSGLYAQQFNDMGNLLGNAGTMQLQRQAAGGQMATGVQNLQQGRLGQQMGFASDLAHLGAGLYGGFYGQGGAKSGDAAMAGINAGANAAQLRGLGQTAGANQMTDLGKAALGGGFFNSGGGGGAAGAGTYDPNGLMGLSF